MKKRFLNVRQRFAALNSINDDIICSEIRLSSILEAAGTFSMLEE
jgi:hypothetical protein